MGRGGPTLRKVARVAGVPPTAVFACSDPMALGACRALAERGIDVPEGMSLVGFDDLPEARWARPPLTTVRQPLTEMAATAMRMLIEVMRGRRPETDRIELATSLAVRASTASLRRR